MAAKNLTFGYGTDSPVLRGLDAEFPAGALTAILGPNGAGKSTLLKLLAGLLRPGDGAVSLDGAAPSALSARRRAKQLAYVPQRGSLAFPFSVAQVVRLGRYAADGDHDGAVDRALETMAIAHRAGEPFGVLSTGQQQRVTLARALAQLDPARPGQVLLADEPISAMDPRHALAAMNVLVELARHGGLAVVAVLHDPTLALRLADRVLLLNGRGEKAAEGPAEQVLTPENLENVFGVAFERLTSRETGSRAIVPVGD
jgi:iron complex transport system ATP-binding protein